MERVQATVPDGPSPKEEEAICARREFWVEEYSKWRKKQQQLVDSMLLKVVTTDAAGDVNNGDGSGTQDPPPPRTTTLLGKNMRVDVGVVVENCHKT